jgi:hydroxyethylthiazole kinase-like uncharacterized protein yjeF
MIIIDPKYIQKIAISRKPDSHTGHHGHALLIAGSKSKMGAAIIMARACLRTGAGLVTVNIPKKERSAVFTAVPEAMVAFREDENNWDKYNAIGIGPGLGTNKKAERKVESVLAHVKIRMVFDADALTILGENQTWFDQLPPQSILTPHPNEFDRLFGNHETEAERRQTAITKAKTLKCILILKGHKTFITDGELSFENTTGNSGLAKGGSGDALTGIITALLAQGYEPINAAVMGVYIHGLAADITLQAQSSESMLITDVIENMGAAFQQIHK